jgi:heptosyltransferase-2
VHKILVVGPSWIGDTVLAQPLFKLLHERHPGLALDVLAPDWTLPLLEHMPEVRRAIPSPFGHGEVRLLERRRLGRALAAEGYAQAIVLPNSLKSALVPWFASIPVRTGYVGEMRGGVLTDARRLDERRLPQIAQRYAALALAPGEPLPQPLPAPALVVDDSRRRAALERLGLESSVRAVALCPGAEYGPAKRWPARHFARLAAALAAEGWRSWVVGSASEAALGEEIVRSSGGACANLCGRTQLAEAIAVLASAALVVTNDSGLMHVAAALGRPLVALYGSSSPEFTPPLSPLATVLRLDLPCSPCFERVCPLGHFRCMTELAPERVLAAARSARIGAP